MPGSRRRISPATASSQPTTTVRSIRSPAKNPAAIIAPLRGRLASLSVVPAPGHDAHSPAEFAAHSNLAVRAFDRVADALKALPRGGDVLIAGSLYLAGDVLRLNQELPD